MKNIKLLTTLAICLFTAGSAEAQQQEEKNAKPIPEAITKKQIADKSPSAVPANKPIADDAVPAKPVPPTNAPVTVAMKGTEINPGVQKPMPVANANGAKTSTIEPVKKTDPAAKPKPVVVVPVED